MKVGLVGPAHPYKGGVAQHTTTLAHRLRRAGHDVRLVSWRRQYPRRLYPGQLEVDGPPEVEPFSPTSRELSWNSPWSWVRAAWRLRRCDLVAVAHVTPVQVPVYAVVLLVLRLLGVSRVVICHNVLPHERGPLDRTLVRVLLGLADRVIVHSDAERQVAAGLTGRPVGVAALAPFPPTAFGRGEPLPGEHRRLLFFGLVRPYKGLDLLLEALANGPQDVRLRVAGEFWGGTEAVERQLHALGLEDRVELRAGYVAAEEVPGLFADVDALVLPYRTATGSQAVSTAYDFGVPVIATRVGGLAQSVRDDVDGLVADPSAASIGSAVERFYSDGTPLRLRAGVRPADHQESWTAYVRAMTDQTERTGRRDAQTAGAAERGEAQLLYSDLQPLMADEKHRRTKARKIVSVLEEVLGEGGLGEKTVVDIGCSVGFIADELASKGARTLGLDVDKPGLVKARDRFGERVQFLLGSGETLPFADESLDVVVFNHIYEHVPDPDAVLSEIHRTLRPDGVAYLGLGNKHQLIEPHYRLPFLSWLPRPLADRFMRVTGRGSHYYETYRTRAGLREMLRGFRILDFTVPVVNQPGLFGAGDQVGRSIPVPVARAARPVIPTFIWVATKGDRLPVRHADLAGLAVLDERGRSR